MKSLLFVFWLSLINLVPAQNTVEGICMSGNCETGFGIKKYKALILFIELGLKNLYKIRRIDSRVKNARNLNKNFFFI